MGGSSGSRTTRRSSAPEQGGTLDYAALMRSANAAAGESYAAQMQAYLDNYPAIEQASLGTVQQIANNLSNAYTQVANESVGRSQADAGNIRGQANAMDASAYQITGVGDQVRGIGNRLEAQAGETAIERELRHQAERELTADPSFIEKRLLSDAERDLALGRSLNAEELRDAQQSARAAFAARGLSGSLGSSAAEILNRDAYARQREQQRRAFAMDAEQYYNAGIAARRNFAGATNQMVAGNVAQRLGQAAATLGGAADIYGTSANVRSQIGNAYSQAANIDQSGAQIMANNDPYYRALGYGASMSGNIGNNITNSVSNAYSNAQNLAGSVGSFNINALDSRYNSYMNNQSALSSARMQAGAANRSATMGMVGAGVGAAAGLAVVGIAI